MAAPAKGFLRSSQKRSFARSLLGCRALDRLLVEEAAARRTDRSLHLVRDAVTLDERERRDLGVLVDRLHRHLRFTLIRRSAMHSGLSATFHKIFTRPLALLCLAAMGLAGCAGKSGRRVAGPTTTTTQAPATTTAPSCAAGAFRRLGSDARAYAGAVRSHAVVLPRPGGAPAG